MEIVFDSNKDKINKLQHGISLADARLLEWDYLIATKDTRFSYGEVRMIGFAPIGIHVFCLVFTVVNDCYRIISLRRATKQEVKKYASQI